MNYNGISLLLGCAVAYFFLLERMNILFVTTSSGQEKGTSSAIAFTCIQYPSHSICHFYIEFIIVSNAFLRIAFLSSFFSILILKVNVLIVKGFLMLSWK